MRFTRDELAGNWRVRRHIEDRLRGETAYFTGVVVFAPAEDGFVYREGGRLHLADGRAMEAHQAHRWIWRGDGRIEIRFADGAPFHVLDPAAPERPLLHLCGADRYEGAYAVTGPQLWSLRWDIAGPRKAQTITSRYSRR